MDYSVPTKFNFKILTNDKKKDFFVFIQNDIFRKGTVPEIFLMDKKTLTERDICTKFITPAIKKAGWNIKKQVREEVFFTDGRVIVQGSVYT